MLLHVSMIRKVACALKIMNNVEQNVESVNRCILQPYTGSMSASCDGCPLFQTHDYFSISRP
jgi:hypothetical protein